MQKSSDFAREPPRMTAGCARKTWEQLGNNIARTPGKRTQHGGPESKTSQPHRLFCRVCKTSIPGSNPGGASILRSLMQAKDVHHSSQEFRRAKVDHSIVRELRLASQFLNSNERVAGARRQAALLQSQLDYVQAADEMDAAIGRRPR
jgi:hypothetical protein